MKNLKHIGRIKNTNSKVLVVFRTLPGESDQALVLPVENLTADRHDSIMKLVETDQAQDTFEFGEIMFIRTFPDGKRMLLAAQSEGMLRKMPTDSIIMTPNTRDEVPLNDLNVYIAEQKNCAVDDLHTFVSGSPKPADKTTKEIAEVENITDTDTLPSSEPLVITSEEALDDVSLAKNYRSQADALYKEAARLRREADELDPPAKKVTKPVKEKADA